MMTGYLGADWRRFERRRVAVGLRSRQRGHPVPARVHRLPRGMSSVSLSTEVSRERRSTTRTWRDLIAERARGANVIWFVGPPSFTPRARNFVWFIQNSFSGVLAGNSVAVHDIEGSEFAGRWLAKVAQIRGHSCTLERSKGGAAGTIEAALSRRLKAASCTRASAKCAVLDGASTRDDGRSPESTPMRRSAGACASTRKRDDGRYYRDGAAR